MTYKIKIEIFEGPFDLLFHLIEKDEIDIYDIPITEITDQYLSYIANLEELNLEVTSEFLVMAATLIEIKSKTLLPVQLVESDEKNLENLDPREELVKRLLEYKKYRFFAKKLKDRERDYNRIYFKHQEDFMPSQEDWSCQLDKVNMDDLLSALNKLIEKKSMKIHKNNIVAKIERDSVTVEEKIDSIITILKREKKIRFQDLFSRATGRVEIITTFLALLEIIRLRQASLRQDKAFGEIVIQLKNLEKGGAYDGQG